MVVLVSIIPFRRRLLLRLLTIAHKFMWVSLAFMATAFTSATWCTLPTDFKTNWLPNVVVAVVGGFMGSVFIYLGLVLVKHWIRKLKWRRERANKKKSSVVAPVENNSDGNSVVESTISTEVYSDAKHYKHRASTISTNSDVASSTRLGGHPI